MSADVAGTVDLYTDDSASPMTVTVPGAFGSGQLAIMGLVGDSGVLADYTAATGFTPITGADVDISGQRFKAFYHVWDGTEAATWDFGYNSGAAAAGGLVRVSGADVAAPTFVAATGNSGSNPASMDSPSANPTGNDDLFLSFLTNSGGSSAFSYTKPTAMTDRGSAQLLNLHQAIAVASEPLTSGSATGVRTWTSIAPTGRQAGVVTILIKSDAGTPEIGIPQGVLRKVPRGRRIRR